MASTITWDDVRTLGQVQTRAGCAISLYLDLDPSVTPTAGDVATRVNSLLDEAAKSPDATRDDLSHDARQALRTDFDRIRQFFDQEFVRDGARGAAVFCGSLDGLWATRALVASVEDAVHVDRQLLVAPLAGLVGRGDRALIVAAGREQGRFYGLRDGRIEELADLSDRQPRRHDQGGWSQARMQRHVDELASEHLREVAEEVDKRVRAVHGDVSLVIFAPEESRAELAGLLSQEAQGALAGWAHAEAHAGPPELLELALPVLEAARKRQAEELLERWREEAGRGARATTGWAATLEAASDGRVETLLVGAGSAREAWRCPECGRASATEGECALDGTPMERVDTGLDLAVRRTVLQGGTVIVLDPDETPDLGPADGIGALLRF
jgi:peptide chain release factor subunit 1